MPLTRTRTPAITQHAIRRRARGPLLATTVLAATVALLAGTAAALTTIDRAADVSVQAERVVTTGEGLLFPIEPSPVCEVFNNYGAYSKSGQLGGHQGVDIGTAWRQEVYAVEAGWLYRQFDDATAGLGWGLWSDTDAKYRYFHLDELAPDLQVGDAVVEGQLIGWTGDTGNAAPGGYHLHFEVRPGPQPARGDADTVDPVPLLDIPTVCHLYPKQ